MYEASDPVFLWILQTALACGMWWAYPHFLATSKEFRTKLQDDFWRSKVRVAHKISGAVTIFKSKMEYIKIKKILVNHVALIGMYSDYSAVGQELCKISTFFIARGRCGEWTRTVLTTFSIDSKGAILYYVIQLALIMRHYKLGNTVAYKLLEARMDISIHSLHTFMVKKSLYYTRKNKLSFRQIIEGIEKSPSLFKFLYRINAFDSAYYPCGIPEYMYLERLYNWNSRSQKSIMVYNLPLFVKGCIAFLALVNATQNSKTLSYTCKMRFQEFGNYIGRPYKYFPNA